MKEAKITKGMIDRRTFLKSTGILTAAAATGLPVLVSKKSWAKKEIWPAVWRC